MKTLTQDVKKSNYFLHILIGHFPGLDVGFVGPFD